MPLRDQNRDHNRGQFRDQDQVPFRLQFQGQNLGGQFRDPLR